MTQKWDRAAPSLTQVTGLENMKALENNVKSLWSQGNITQHHHLVHDGDSALKKHSVNVTLLNTVLTNPAK